MNLFHVPQANAEPLQTHNPEQAGMVSLGQYQCQPTTSEPCAFRYVKGDTMPRKGSGTQEDLRFNAFIHTRNELTRAVAPIFLLPIPFLNAECRTQRKIQPATQLERHLNTLEHTAFPTTPPIFSVCLKYDPLRRHSDALVHAHSIR